jgi:hypothetical protein
MAWEVHLWQAKCQVRTVYTCICQWNHFAASSHLDKLKSFPAGPKIPCILQAKAHHCGHRSPPTVSLLRQINPAQHMMMQITPEDHNCFLLPLSIPLDTITSPDSSSAMAMQYSYTSKFHPIFQCLKFISMPSAFFLPPGD